MTFQVKRVRCLRYGSYRFPKQPLGTVFKKDHGTYLIKLDNPKEVSRGYRSGDGVLCLYPHEVEDIDVQDSLEDLL